MCLIPKLFNSALRSSRSCVMNFLFYFSKIKVNFLLTIDFTFRFVSSQCVVKLYFSLIVYLLCTAVSGS